MSNCISFRGYTTFAILSCISSLSHGATSLETPPIISHSAVMEVAPPPAQPTVTLVVPPTPVSSVATFPTLSASPLSSVPASPRLTAAVVAKPPKIAPPKLVKKVRRRAVVRRASPPAPVVAAYNQPYIELGTKYFPLQNAVNYFQRGEATWYSKSHQGQATVNGEIYDVYGMTAAHPILPIPSYARVTNLSNRKSVVVRINDRGPFGFHKKIIDLSYAAANKIGLVGSDNRRIEILSLAQDMPTATTHTSKAKITFKSPTKAITRPPAPLKPAINAVHTGETYVQLGAFKTVASAQNFKAKVQQQLGERPASLAILAQGNLHRVRMGPYVSRKAAQDAASEMTPILGFKPILK